MGATRFVNYELCLIPGLLQTPEYTTALVTAAQLALSAVEVQNLVVIRMSRQVRLRNPRVQLLAVLDEMALQRMVGDREVMYRQLLHLVECAGRAGIIVRVVPSGVGQHAGWRGPFLLMDYPGEPSIVALEVQGVAVFLEEPDDVADIRLSLANILEHALSPDDSLDLISRTAEKLYGNPDSVR